MTTPPQMSPPQSDERPSAARMYDYFLGGFHNFASDRAAADAATAIYPEFPRLMRANRAFLRRSVAFLCAQGIDQFLDLGSGIPTVGNVHEVAQQHNPSARVVYVDVDPLAVSQSAALLADNPTAVAIQGDTRQPETILGHPEVQRLLDLSRPFAVLLVALLHFVTDDATAYGMVRTLSAALPSGGYLVISHASHEGLPPGPGRGLEELYAHTTNPVRLRSRKQTAAFFEGLELVPPGVVHPPIWHPESQEDLFVDHPELSAMFAGVGRKP